MYINKLQQQEPQLNEMNCEKVVTTTTILKLTKLQLIPVLKTWPYLSALLFCCCPAKQTVELDSVLFVVRDVGADGCTILHMDEQIDKLSKTLQKRPRTSMIFSSFTYIISVSKK